tara:strand:+ start:264 stop:533 length:270 start_codon:yes stop_codon:yes gene_type:complete
MPMTPADKRRQRLKQEQTNTLRRLGGLKPIDFNKKPVRANTKYKGPKLSIKGLFGKAIRGITKPKKKPLTMIQKMLKKPIGAKMRPKKK